MAGILTCARRRFLKRAATAAEPPPPPPPLPPSSRPERGGREEPPPTAPLPRRRSMAAKKKKKARSTAGRGRATRGNNEGGRDSGGARGGARHGHERGVCTKTGRPRRGSHIRYKRCASAGKVAGGDARCASGGGGGCTHSRHAERARATKKARPGMRFPTCSFFGRTVLWETVNVAGRVQYREPGPSKYTIGDI